MTEKQLLELLEKFGAAIRDAILLGIRDIRDNARLSEITRMIEQRNIEGVLRALGYDPAVFNPYQRLLAQAFEDGAILAMSARPKYTADSSGIQTMLRFNIRDRDAERWLAERSSSLITGIEEDVRSVTRETLRQGLEDGRNPRSVALDIVGRYNRATGHREGGVVGLGQREMLWSLGARRKLLELDPSYFEMDLRDKRFDSVVRKAIADGKPLPLGTVEKLVDQYRERALKHRGDSIGRTEALAALNRSEYEATKQALAQSGLPPSAAVKVWDSAGDARVRNTHRDMDDQRVGIDEPFVSPSGARMMHPHDTSLGAPGKETIMCRCRVRYEINFAAGVK